MKAILCIAFVISAIAAAGCASTRTIKEGPHRGWSETLQLEDDAARERSESDYQNALQRLD